MVGRLTVNQVTRIGTRFDSLYSHQFIGVFSKTDSSVNGEMSYLYRRVGERSK